MIYAAALDLDMAPLGEFGRIERFFRPLTRNFAGAFDLTDDAATIVAPPGKQLVVTTDAIVAGVHFFPSDNPGDIARKALRVNLSDLAAKGADPFVYLLTLATGSEIDDHWIEAFVLALAQDQDAFGIILAGGDSVSTPGPVWVSITAFGTVDAGRMVRRNGARPGDLVFVTGAIGDAALGLAIVQSALSVPSEDKIILTERYRIPQPRTGLAQALCANAHAALDISDGLAADFGHICRASGVRGVIQTPLIPLSPAARRAVAHDPGLMHSIFGGGDDYEILFTAPPSASAKLRSAAFSADIALTNIGTIESGEPGAVLLDADGNALILQKAGWTHT